MQKTIWLRLCWLTIIFNDMELIKFNYRPDVAVKAIDTMVEQNANDPDCKPEQRKIFEDMKTLVHLGADTLRKEPLKTGPAIPGNNKKS